MGGTHTCALTIEGGVSCWGDNSKGQLGDSQASGDFSTEPVDVLGLTSGVAKISTLGDQTCVVTTAGAVKCWGNYSERNNLGSTEPVDVVGLESGVIDVSPGGLVRGIWAVTTARELTVSSQNPFGGGSSTTRVSMSGVAAVSVALTNICAVTTAGGLKCLLQSSTPEDVTGLTSGVASVSAGTNLTCAVTTAGGLKCWGLNNSGQLGDGTNVNRATPVDVAFLTSGVVSVSAGSAHTCAVTTEAGLKCWGNNSAGQLGDAKASGGSSNTPIDVPGLTSGVASVSVGNTHTCVLTTEGNIKCWGDNSKGQLGDGTAGTIRTTPVDVIGFGAVPILAVAAIAVSAGDNHTCALTAGGGAKCWGSNVNGQLGNEEAGDTFSTIPADVTGLTGGVAALSVGVTHTCAVTTAGGLKCWGDNRTGQLGDETSGLAGSDTPVDVVGLTSGVASVSAGSASTCAVTTAGGLKCWGNNQSGQLGDGTNRRRTTPVDVMGLTSGVASVSVATSHTCAVTTAGGLKCWGSNQFGQVGDGMASPFRIRAEPVEVVGLSSGVAAVSTGLRHTCALLTTGGVKCWGFNARGQMGDFTTADRATPVDVYELESGVKSISVGSGYTCALTTTGGVKCWGENSSGQLGDEKASGEFSNKPVDVVGLSSGVAAVSAGERHTCALLTTGGIECWGTNRFGIIGDGTAAGARFTPVDVVGFAGTP